jgi:hypothetical protein
MRELRLLCLCLIGAALLTFSATATADKDDEPSVAALAATEVTSSSALLHAGVNPNDESTLYHFEYGQTTAYGSQTPTASAGRGDNWVLASARVSGLAASTTYHFRIVATNNEGTARGSDRTFTTQAAPAGPAPPAPTTTAPDSAPTGPASSVEPETASNVGAAPKSGLVLVRVPGSADFTPLTSGSQLPYGSEVDATGGSLNITSALPSGETQTGLFGAGRFVVRKGRRGYVDLHLLGPVCRRGASRRSARTASVTAAAAASSKRRLWGRDSGGRFRTHGKNSHATVRGTRWSIADSCAGTLTRVTEGSVVVRDKGTGKRKLLTAGERYLARPRR